jgi:hypothetical protein
MKKYLLKLTILSCLMALPLLSTELSAQPLPPPAGHGQTGSQPAGAPLDGGFSILVLLAAVYGGGRLHFGRKKEKTDTN